MKSPERDYGVCREPPTVGRPVIARQLTWAMPLRGSRGEGKCFECQAKQARICRNAYLGRRSWFKVAKFDAEPSRSDKRSRYFGLFNQIRTRRYMPSLDMFSIDPDFYIESGTLRHRESVGTKGKLIGGMRPGNKRQFEKLGPQLDSVVCLNVLEHVEDDLLGLRNIHSCLKPGGRAIILVPQGAAVYGTLDKVLGHYRRYSKNELATKMTSAGYRVERVVEFNRITYPGWYVNGTLLRRSHFSRFQLTLFDELVWLWRRLDRHIPWPPTSLIAVGVRES